MIYVRDQIPQVFRSGRGVGVENEQLYFAYFRLRSETNYPQQIILKQDLKKKKFLHARCRNLSYGCKMALNNNRQPTVGVVAVVSFGVKPSLS